MPIVMCVEVNCQSANRDKCEDDLERHIVRFRCPSQNANRPTFWVAACPPFVIANAESMLDKCAARL